MAEPNEPAGPEQSDEPEHESTAQDRAGETETEDVEDLDVDDEEITERVRGGKRAISIPYGY